jgi:hypothetical protein
VLRRKIFCADPCVPVCSGTLWQTAKRNCHPLAVGLDIDALRDVANAVNGLKTDKTATLMVTHYKRLLNYIKPEHVHVMEVRTAAPCCPECCCHSRSLVPPEWQGR